VNPDIIKALEQDAQTITERMPTTMDDLVKTRAALTRFLRDEKISQAEIARKLGLSDSIISQYLKGRYEGDNAAITNKIVNYINDFSRRKDRLKNDAFVETTIAREIGTLIANAMTFADGEEGGLGVIIGDSGHGKSCCLKQFALANKNTTYVELDKGLSNTMMFAAIARAVGVDSGGSLATVTRTLIESLQNRHHCLLLDEASHLGAAQLDLLRQIIVIKCRSSLVLAGNRHLLHTINDPHDRRGYESLDQFYGRLVRILDLDALAAAGTTPGGRSQGADAELYTEADIRKLYEFGGLRLTRDAVETLRQACRAPMTGRVRTCKRIIDMLHLPSSKAHDVGQIDAAMIISAFRQLRLPVIAKLPFAILDAPRRAQQPTAEQAASAG